MAIMTAYYMTPVLFAA